MRTLVALLMVSTAVLAADPEPCPISKEKWSAGDAEKAWGLKVKAVSYQKDPLPEFRMTLEFSKDLQPDELTQLRQGFAKQQTAAPRRIEIHFFDVENVVAYKSNNYNVQGDMTGRKGDAFRLIIPVVSALSPLNAPQNAARVQKVELRKLDDAVKGRDRAGP
jgi:hypothetical protein